MAQIVGPVYKHSSFYFNRGVDFSVSEGDIPIANRNNCKIEDIQNKYVVFSDAKDRGDLFNMPFPVKDIRKGNHNYLSGAARLWYSMRSEIYNRWDYYLSDIWAYIYALIVGLVYFIFQDGISKAFGDGLLRRVLQFAMVMLFELLVIPLLGVFIMFFHVVMPLTQSAIIIVFIDILKNDVSHE